MRHLNPKNRAGFTAIELIFGLFIFMGLILMANSVLNSIYQAKQNNQLSDQVTVYQSSVIRYISDNYRVIDQQLASTTTSHTIIIPEEEFASYFPIGILASLSNGYRPCLYITTLAEDSLHYPFKAYLIFGAPGKITTKLTFNNTMSIAHKVGGNAGVLIPGESGFILQGLNAPGITLPNNLITQCGFTSEQALSEQINYLLVVDVTANKELFSQIKLRPDTMSNGLDSDPSLKRIGSGNSVTMQTNLYLDNVVKESSYVTKSYCDAAQLPVNDAVTLCTNYAGTNDLGMYAGTASWISSILSADEQSCTATARAHFYSSTMDYTCNGVIFPSASSFCPATRGGMPQSTGSAYWLPPAGILSGSQCVATAYVTYASCPTITCTGGSSGIITCSGNPTLGRAVCSAANPHWSILYLDNPTGNCNFRDGICTQSYTGTYNASINQCGYQIYCLNGSDGSGGRVTGYVANANGGGPQSCGQTSIPAKSSLGKIDLGFKSC